MTNHPWRTVAVFAVIAATARFVAALGHPVSWIFADEFVYFEGARNFGDHAAFAVRDQPEYLSLVTTLLNAPGFTLFGDTDSAYVWIKGINTVAMVSAVFPAFGLARMVLSTRVALLFAGLVLAWPSFAYVQVVMTEPAFLPAFLLAVWLVARAVEKPSVRRQALALGAVGLCVGVRLQLAILLVAVPIVCLVAALRGREGDTRWLARLRPLWPLLVASIGLPLLAVVAQVLRGRPVRSLLGGYENNDLTRVDLGTMLPWLGRHVAVVGLALLVVPAAIAVAVLVRFVRRGGSAPHTGVLSAILVVVPLLTLQVATYASVYSLRVAERNLFVVEPLLLLAALVGISGFGYSRIVAVAASGGFALLAFVLPVAGLLSPPPYSETFSLLSFMQVAGHLGIAPETLVRVVAVAAVAATVALVFARARPAFVAVGAALLAMLAWSSYEVTRLIHGYSTNVANVLVPKPRDWIDRAVGPGGRVALLWPAGDPPLWAWQQEIWNRSIRSVVAIDGSFIETTRGSFSPDTGAYVPEVPGDVPPEELVVAPGRWRIDGEKVADAKAVGLELSLWRIRKPLRLSFNVTGVFADGWTGRSAQLDAYGCRPGAFHVTLLKGFGAVQRATVVVPGRPPQTIELRTDRPQRFRFPAAPDPATGACRLTLDVADTATGDEIAKNGDPRELGVLLTSPEYVDGA